MADIAHIWGGDLSWGADGDLAISTGGQETLESLLRALMTNPGGYIWHVSYGAGLPQMVGQPVHADSIIAIVQAQLALDSDVAQSPAPVVTVTAQDPGTIVLQVKYTDASTGMVNTLRLAGG